MQYYIVNHFNLTPFPHLRRLSQASLINGIMVVQQRPKSRGTVRVTSADPREAPVVDLNFLQHPDDVRTLIEGIRECSRLMQHDYVLANRERQFILRDDALDDDDVVRVYLKTTLDGSYHPVGTARMGPSGTRMPSWTRMARSTASTASTCATPRSCPTSPAPTRI